MTLNALDQLVSVFPEMAFEGERRGDSRPPHDFEAGAIDQAETASGGGQMRPDGRVVDVPGDPFDAEDGDDIRFEDAGGFHPHAARDERRGFDEDIVMADEDVAAEDRLFPAGA